MADSTLSYNAYDPNVSAQQNAQNMINNQNQQYQGFLGNLPQYQSNMQNQALDQGNTEYNNAKSNIDRSANARGLLYSGLKQGAEQGAANTAANDTQKNIATGNQNLNNYATQYGNQVTQSNIANQQGNVNNALSTYQQQMQNFNQSQQFTGQAAGGALSLGALISSDEKVKDGVKDGAGDAQEMIDKLDSKKFSYKEDPEKKVQLGILAQDMEKSPMGKAIVVETKKGKALDIGKALSAVLAVQSVLNKRLNKAGA